MRTLSQWGWPLCGLFLVLVYKNISPCSSGFSEQAKRGLMEKGNVPSTEIDYYRCLRLCFDADKDYEDVDFHLTDKTIFRCSPIGYNNMSQCYISELEIVQVDKPSAFSLWCKVNHDALIASDMKPPDAKLIGQWVYPWIPFDQNAEPFFPRNDYQSLLQGMFNCNQARRNTPTFLDDVELHFFSATTACDYLFGTGRLQYYITSSYDANTFTQYGLVQGDTDYIFSNYVWFTIRGNFRLYVDESLTTLKKFEGLTAILSKVGKDSYILLALFMLANP
eukprot:GHVS01101269.1.p1 GENE.GHVS01101269.1~~GHVS01101269.1.p1  ORF type:complete len:278 (+),score=2.76 GHVS01101269.1:165-998(+)